METSFGRSSAIKGSEDVVFSIGGLGGFKEAVLIGGHDSATVIIDDLEFGIERDILFIMKDSNIIV